MWIDYTYSHQHRLSWSNCLLHNNTPGLPVHSLCYVSLWYKVVLVPTETLELEQLFLATHTINYSCIFCHYHLILFSKFVFLQMWFVLKPLFLEYFIFKVVSVFNSITGDMNIISKVFNGKILPWIYSYKRNMVNDKLVKFALTFVEFSLASVKISLNIANWFPGSSVRLA